MNILGISAFYHDSAACIVKNGKIIAATQEERFTRKKHDDSFPQKAIDYCLKEAKISVNDLDYVTFYENPALKFNRIVDTIVHIPDIPKKTIEQTMDLWCNQKLWQERIIRNKLDYHGKIIFALHHESHAASAFFPSPFKDAAIVTIDGVGEWMTTTMGLGITNRIKLLKAINFPHSLGMLYSAFTYYCGFKVNSGEYKLMGLAPYGKAKYVNLIKDNLIDIKNDGSFRLNQNYFDFVKGEKMINQHFCDLFGHPERVSESEIDEFYMDVAKSIQIITEDIVLKIIKTAKQITNSENLCMAGGVALNCVANGKILESKLFKEIWIQPASGDAGGALGAALYTWYQYLDNERLTDEKNDSQLGSYLGPKFNDSDIEIFLQKGKVQYKKLDEDKLIDKISDLIINEKVIGHFAGRMEFGPRALGNRSIIGDARSPNLQKVMNLKIKKRESFRPFAPAVTEENCSEFFELTNTSPYMLLTTQIKESVKIKNKNENNLNGLNKLKIIRSKIPAITHVDFSARVQTVNKNSNPRFYNIINRVGKKNNIPIIINTSFNVRGEPIVCTPQDAYNCFINTDMDYLVIENYLIEKNKN